MESCSSLLGWNVHCLLGFEFLGQLGWGLLLQEGGVASFLAAGGGFDATRQWQYASMAVCTRVRHMAYSCRMCADLDRKRSVSLAPPYLAILLPSCFPSFPCCAHFPFFLPESCPTPVLAGNSDHPVLQLLLWMTVAFTAVAHHQDCPGTPVWPIE